MRKGLPYLFGLEWSGRAGQADFIRRVSASPVDGREIALRRLLHRSVGPGGKKEGDFQRAENISAQKDPRNTACIPGEKGWVRFLQGG